MNRAALAALLVIFVGLVASPGRAEAQRPWYEQGRASEDSAEPVPEGWERPAGPRILLLTGRGLESMRDIVSGALLPVGSLAPHQGYLRAARRAGRRWNELSTYAELLPEQGVELVVVVDRAGPRGRSRLHMTYRHGRTGEVLLETEHGHGGDFDGTAARVEQEARLAARVVMEQQPAPASTVPEVSAPAPSEGMGSEESAPLAPEESRSTVGIRLSAGVGGGSLQAKLASNEGVLRLSIERFAVVDTALTFDIVPRAEASHSFFLGVTYRTSVGLTVQDARGDGLLREAPARVQRLEALAGLDLAHGSRLTSTLELGWAVHVYDSPADLSFPDHNLTGPLLRLSEGVALWEGGLSVLAGVEVNYLVTIADSLEVRGVANRAWAVGWLGTLHLPLSDVLAAQLAYRESHVMLPMANGNTGYERERFLALRLHYRP